MKLPGLYSRNRPCERKLEPCLAEVLLRNANSLVGRSGIRAAVGLSPKVAIITGVCARELERARSAGMQGDNIVGLEAYSFNNIDLTVRVFVEVVRPAFIAALGSARRQD